MNSSLSVDEKSTIQISTKLGHSFGEILNLKVEIIHGNTLRRKAVEGMYLMKILEVNSKPVEGNIYMTFVDETGKFPRGCFELYKYLYGKETGSLSYDQVGIMEKQYLGKEANIMAYETGAFTGVPDGYFDYQPLKSTTGFYFESYLIIISNNDD